MPLEDAKYPRPKLVRIVSRLCIGGVGLQACALHEELASSFDTLLIVGRLAAGEKDMSYLLSSEHNVLRLPKMSREISLWEDALSFWAILKVLRRERPDIVHTHQAKAGALGRFASWIAGVPVIVHTFHGHVFQGYFSPLKTRIYLAIERILGRLSTRVITISESQVREICSKYRIVPLSKASVIKDGFEIGHFGQKGRQEARKALGLAQDAFVVVWAARMAPVKDMQLLARVIRLAAERLVRAYFLVVGDGTERALFEAGIRGCENVVLLGWQDDMATIWSTADVALLTSRNEGTPTSLIEAMSSGIPFVSTDVGAIRDLTVPPLRELPGGVGFQAANGFLTARTPEAILYCLEQAEKDPAVVRKMAALGRAFVLSTFTQQRLVHEMKALYHTLLEQSGKKVYESSQKASGDEGYRDGRPIRIS